MSLKDLELFKQNEQTEDYNNRGANDKNFLFEIEDKKYNYVGENLVSFETSDKIVEYSSIEEYNDIEFPFVYGEENIYFMLPEKCIPIEEYKNSTQKDEHEFLCKKYDEFKADNITDENEGTIDYGNDFTICKINQDRGSI